MRVAHGYMESRPPGGARANLKLLLLAKYEAMLPDAACTYTCILVAYQQHSKI